MTVKASNSVVSGSCSSDSINRDRGTKPHFTRNNGHMACEQTQTAENRLRHVLDELYRIFEAPAPRPPLLICDCNSCLTPHEQEELCSYPLREIPAGFLQAYMTSVSDGVCHRRTASSTPSTTASPPEESYTEGDLRAIRQRQYYLPRICEGLVRGEEVSILDEVALQKFAFDCPGAYSDAQLAVVTDFARTWFEELCRFPHPYHPRHEALPWVLEMLWTAGLDLTEQLCSIWQASVEHVPAVRNYLGVREDLVSAGVHAPEAAPRQADQPRREESSVQQTAERLAGAAGNHAEARNSTDTAIPATAETSSNQEEGIVFNAQPPTADSFSTQLAAWVLDPEVQAAFTRSLEEILLAGAEEPEETHEWEAWYFYFSGS